MSCGVGRRCSLDLAFAMPVVQAGDYSSDSNSSLGTSIYHRCGPRKKTKEKTNKQTNKPKRTKNKQNFYFPNSGLL